MGLYKVPVEWRERGYLLVHASTQKEAAKVAMNGLDIYPLHNQPIGGSLKLAFSVDELDYTLNALTYDVLESVIKAIDNAPTIEVKGNG